MMAAGNYKVQVEVARIEVARWAPTVPDKRFRWAWRAIASSGNSVSGLSRTKKEAVTAARTARRRMEFINSGDGGSVRPLTVVRTRKEYVG